jgi:ATP-dependent DNA ligase
MLSLAVRRVQADAGSPSTRLGNGEDLRSRPLGERKTKLARLLARAPVSIVFNEHTEDGVVVFRHACKMGLEGIVSKRLTAPIGPEPRGTGSR